MSALTLHAGLVELGLSTTREIEHQLTRYLDLLAKWNGTYNLTAIRSRDRMIVEHVFDSLAITSHLRPERILDIGSGAGLPGLPIAIVCPQYRVTLLDSNHKKCTFLRQATIELGLPNVTVVCERVEKCSELQFDTVVSRAFAETQHFAKVASPLCAQHGVMLAMKGLYPHEELTQLPAGVVLTEVVPIVVPGLDARRHLVIMTNA